MDKMYIFKTNDSVYIPLNSQTKYP